MIAITPPKIFSKEATQKQATPFPRQDLLTARNRLDQISGEEAWMNFRFSRALPPGGGSHTSALDDLEAFPSGLGHAANGTTYLPTR